MVPLNIQSNVVNLIEEEKWQRFNEWQERERVAREPRVSLRGRILRASGQSFIALGEKMQRAASMSLSRNELNAACESC